MTTIATRELACGMPLIVESIPGVRSVAVCWLVPAGSATDPEDRQGLCAMWNELIFRGCGELDSRGQADALDRLGISRSCDTSTFHLRLSFTMLGPRLLESLPLLTQMVRAPRFEDDAIGPTRELALQSLRSLADDPQERAVLASRERHNPAPLNRSGLGNEGGLNAVTRADLLEGWSRQVRPRGLGVDAGAGAGNGRWGGGSILSVAGDVDAAGGIDAIGAAMDRLLKGWEGAAPAVSWGASPTKGTYHHIEDASSQVQIVLMHDGPAEPSADCPAERVVNGVLSGGMAARLFTEVREKRGLCYSVSSSYATDRSYGRVMSYVGTTPERAQQSLDVLVAELKRINGRGDGKGGGGGVTREEFDRAITGIKASLVFSGESTGARAAALASDQHRVGRPRSLAELAETFDRLTLEDVNAYLERRKLGAMTFVTLGPSALTPPV